MLKVNEFNSSEKILKYQDKLDKFFNAHKTLIVTELDLTNRCNHMCPGCCGVKDVKGELSKEQISSISKQLKDMQNQGVIISGGGEPTISPNFIFAVRELKKAGMNLGLNSNGTALNEEKAEIICENMEYFRISLDAATPEIYAKTYGMKESHFNKTIKNIQMFANIKAKTNSKVSFGVGFLTSTLTEKDMEKFVLICKNNGADFAQFRPFHGDKMDVVPILEELKNKYETPNFKVVASMQKYRQIHDINSYKRDYDKCRGMFFSTVITANYKVFACIHYRQQEKYMLGDLSKNTLEEIFKSARIRQVYESIDCYKCPNLCRNDSFNRTLNRLDLDIFNSEFL